MKSLKQSGDFFFFVGLTGSEEELLRSGTHTGNDGLSTKVRAPCFWYSCWCCCCCCFTVTAGLMFTKLETGRSVFKKGKLPSPKHFIIPLALFVLFTTSCCTLCLTPEVLQFLHTPNIFPKMVKKDSFAESEACWRLVLYNQVASGQASLTLMMMMVMVKGLCYSWVMFFLGVKKQKDLRLHVFHSADWFIRIIVIHFCAFILKKSIYADIAHRVLVVSFRLSAFPPLTFLM